MSTWQSITRDQLLTWAKSAEAPQILPELVRRLILETSPVEIIDVPGGSGVRTGGLDGVVRAATGTAFVPAGISVWELSVESDYAKADRDYSKRDSVPDGSPTGVATYIELICRPWTNRRSWAKARNGDGRWKGVRGYNVDTVATWLDHAPLTSAWFARELGLPVDGVDPGAEWWARWTQATDPPLTTAIVLARDEKAIAPLKSQIGLAGVATVGGPVGQEELIGTIVAAALENGERDVARLAVVDDRVTWRRLLKHSAPLILVPVDSSFADDVEPTTKHSVVVPVAHARTSDIKLEPVDPGLLSGALREAGVETSDELASLAHRSFVAFRRRLARHSELMEPPWARGSLSQAARAALLLSGWHDHSEADRLVVEALAGRAYGDAREALLPYTAGDDPYLALAIDRWHVVSPADAWLLVADQLLTDDLRAFTEQAKAILGEIDPALDFPPSERWQAAWKGKMLAYSPQLRNGVATSLALLGCKGELATGSTTGEDWASAAVRALLEQANGDRSGRMWASLSPVLPLFVEAAPRVTLDGLRAGLEGDNPLLRTIFQDDETDSMFGTRSPHTGVLWALENAAWSPEFFANAVELLAALTSIDPGGRMANRPAASLSNIFCPWHPDTSATDGQRLQVIDLLRSRWPDVAWPLMVSLMPSPMGGTHFPTYSPNYRDWKPVQTPLLLADYWAFIEALLQRLLEDVGDSSVRWKAVLDVHDDLPGELRGAVRDALASLEPDRFDDEARREIWDAGRELVARHREFADAQWALPSDEVTQLEEVLRPFTPRRLEDEHGWLFESGWVHLGDLKRRDDFAAYDAELARRRERAVSAIEKSTGLEGIAAFATSVAQPHLVGGALAQAVGDRYLGELLPRVEEANAKLQALARGYVWQLARIGGMPWARQVIESLDPTPLATALLLLYMDDYESGSTSAAELGGDVEREYWLNFSYIGLGNFQYVIQAAHRLVDVGRFASALDFLALYANNAEITEDYAEAVARAFEEFVASGGADESIRQVSQWDFETLFKCLDQYADALGIERVIRIEWYFFPVLGYRPDTTFLHRRLADDPPFFVQMVTWVYRRRSDVEAGVPAPELTEQESSLNENAWRLLHSWHVAPGTAVDGTFDMKACEAWISEARALLRAEDRLDVGEEHIGNALTYTPGEDDGTWPREDVRVLLERLASDSIDRGIVVELLNRRDATSRGLFEGGDQERVRASEYRERAKRFAEESPRTSRIFVDLAEAFESRARQTDSEAEKRRRGLDS